jgi:enoyl-[acyl-carrier protein] reductase II
MVIDAKDTDTIVTGRCTGHPVRGLKNKLARIMLECDRNNQVEEFEKIGIGSLRRAAREGDVVMGSVMAGQSAGLVRERESAELIIRSICVKASELLNKR